MKKKNLLATISIVLALLMFFSTSSAAIGPLSEEVLASNEQMQDNENSDFVYPEVQQSENGEITVPESALRLPDVAANQNEDDIKYGKPVEINEYDKTYQTGGDTFKTIYSAIPNLYKDSSGKGKEYDNTLDLKEKIFTDDYYTNKQSNIDVKLPAAIKEGKGVTFSYNKTKVQLIPTEGDYSRSAVDENAILYNNVFDGIDVQYTVHELGLKEDIVLNKYVEKNSFEYLLDTHGAEAVLENGVICIYEKNSEKPDLYLSAPSMSDNDGKTSESIALELREEDGKYYVTVTADKEWLMSAERAYPVKIDPNFIVPSSNITVVTASERRGVYQGKSYGYAGHLTDDNIGAPGTGDLGKTRMYFQISDDFSSIPEGSKINNASLRIYQYMDYNRGNTQFQCYRIEDPWSVATIKWDNAIKLNQSPCGNNSIVTSAIGFHEFDCRETVNNWVQGVQSNYGFVVQATDETRTGSPFFTPLSASTNPGQEAFTPDKAPQLIIDWEIPNPVDPNYSLNNTTINLRTIIETSKDGKLQFHGIFADGVAKPNSLVTYSLNDSSKDQSASIYAFPSYKFPDSTPFNQYFPARATKYKDIQSNWQTAAPFTNPDFNTVYQYSAHADESGATGNTAKSDEFLIYKIKQFDTLPKIANYYGVPLSQISFDNRVQDMLLVENNTIIIINPTQNGNKPYNPESLSATDKKRIDSLLMGRGLHCEFGFEPINLNTGNLYLNANDISISDYNGNFDIGRTYNSTGAGYNSIFGRGWQFEYSESISKTADGSFVYARGDGSYMFFDPDGKGGYKCPDGYNLRFNKIKVGEKEGDFGGETLEKYDVFEYEITDANGEVRRFNTLGLLSKITDDKGFSTALTYDDNYNLKSIIAPSGNAYAFSYTDGGYVNAVTLPNGKQLTYAYDDNNNLVSYKDAMGSETKYSYDNLHQMTSWTDAEGNVIVTNTYDENGRVTKQVDSNGAVSSLAYTDGQTIATDANGNVTVYHYDDQYRTTLIEYPNGSTEVKEYDANNNLSSITDKNGNKTEYTYDASGNVLSETRFDGAVKKYEYNSDNLLIKTIDYDGKIIHCEYNSAKDLVRQENNDGTVLLYEYDSNHRLTKKTDAKGNSTTYAYDGIWMSQITNADGTVSQYKYDSLGNVISIIDANNSITRFTYDDSGRKTSQQTADGSTVQYSFDKVGDVTGITDAKGNMYHFSYDGLGNILSSTDSYGKTATTVYDGLGNKISETDTNGKKTNFVYDNMSNLVSITDADGYTVSYVYDNAGNKIKETDANGNVTTFEIDYRTDSVEKLTDPDGGVTQYSYDKAGNLLSQTYANGSSFTSSFDNMNRVKTTTSPSGLVTENKYDANGNVIEVKDSADRSISYEYDTMNRCVKMTLPDGNKNAYTYDSVGRLIKKTDSMGGETSYTYDEVGNILSSTDLIGRTTSYEYDLNGNMIKIIAPSGAVTTYEYNAYDLVSKMTDALGNHVSYTYDGEENVLSKTDVYGNAQVYSHDGRNYAAQITDGLGNKISMEYDGNGNNKAFTDAKGNKITYEYGAGDRLVKAISAEGFVVSYEYNSMGQIACESDNTGSKNTYAYDEAGRLVSIIDALGRTTKYTYDVLDNITSIKSNDGNTTKYQYDIMGNMISTEDAEGKVTEYKYDALGNLLTKEDSEHREWKYNYDAAGRLTKAIDPLESSTEYTYNENDLLTGVKNANNISSVNEYDLMGNLTSKTDENGNKTLYTYDSLYRLINTTAADGGIQEYLYDAIGQLVKHKDALGNVTGYSYDQNGNLSSLVTANNGTYNYGYNKDNYQTTITDPLGNITGSTYDFAGRLTEKTLANSAKYTYAYDAAGRITAQTAPEGLSKAYTYDKMGNLASESDQSDRTVSYSYDMMHRLLNTTNANGAKTSFTYDKQNNLSSVVTPLGNKTSYEYDLLDRITKSLDPVGRTEKYTYDPLGNVTEITKTGGRVYSYTYDNNGNLLSETNPLKQTANYAYDSMNRLTSNTDLSGKITSYAYDYNGNRTSVVAANGGVTTYTYDADGNTSSVTDAEGRTVSYAYDLLDRVTSVTQEEIVTASYGYDSVGNLTSVTNGNGKVTNYTYNLLGDMVSLTDPLGNVKQLSYDANAQLQTVTNPDGTTVNYDYDKLDQLLGKSYDDTDVQAMYGYDADGNRISMDDVAGTTEYVYDEVGRITSVYLYGGKEQIKYTYDKYGNLYELMYPDGSSVQYDYDELDRLIQISDRDNKNTSYEYDANGNIIKITRPNNTYTDITYDDIGNVITVRNMRTVRKLFHVTTEEISSFSYSYDRSGFITKELAKQDDKLVERTFAYDGKAQISAVTEKVSTSCGLTWELSSTFYTYDNAGNRIKEEVKHGTVTMNYTDLIYNDADQLTDRNKTVDRITMNTHYSYDANGNLVQDRDNYHCTGKSYTYDNENRLQAVKSGSRLLMAALYNGDGDRIFTLNAYNSENYVTNGRGTALDVYSGVKLCGASADYDRETVKNELLIPNGVTVLNAAQYELTGYINDANSEYTQALMEFGSNGRYSNVYDYGSQRNSIEINGTKSYYTYDGRGSVSNLTGKTGANVVSYNYDIYGEPTATKGGIRNPYLYNAEYTDASTGLQYLRARYYDSETSRFLTKDPVIGIIEKAYSFNPYLYCFNNAINFIDPSGLFFKQVFGTVAGTAKGVWGAAKGVFTKDTVKNGWNSGWNSGKAAGNNAGSKWDTAVSNYIDRQAEFYSNPNAPQINPMAGQSGQPLYIYKNDPITNPQPFRPQINSIVNSGVAVSQAKKEKKDFDNQIKDLDKQIAGAKTEEARIRLRNEQKALQEKRRKLCEEMHSERMNIATGTFDLLGMIPGIGGIFDSVNTVLYLSEGEYLNAGVSAVSAAWDIAATIAALKYVNQMDDVVDTALDASKNIDDAVDSAVDASKGTGGAGQQGAGNAAIGEDLNHVFGNSEHNLNEFLNSYGGNQDNAFNAVQNVAQNSINPNTYVTGSDFILNVNEYSITVRGAFVNGEFRIGTFFIP